MQSMSPVALLIEENVPHPVAFGRCVGEKRQIMPVGHPLLFVPAEFQ
jgi:hypothetical protein